MVTVRNMKQLKQLIEAQANKAMNQGNSVKNTVIKTGQKHVQEDVYDVYTPNENNPYSYKRTGLLKDSWETKETDDGLAIYNTREDEGRDVAAIVETGKGYQYDFEYRDKARPFMENTANELRNSKKLAQALKKDLNSSGIRTN